MGNLKYLVLFFVLSLCVFGVSVSNNHFDVVFDDGGIKSLVRVGDAAEINFIGVEKVLGDFVLRYRSGKQDWREFASADAKGRDFKTEKISKEKAVYGIKYRVGEIEKLEVTSQFLMDGNSLRHEVIFRNISQADIEVGDLAIPLPMKTEYEKHNPGKTFTQTLFRHSFISCNGSFVFWLPVGGVGTHLVMTPDGETGLEYFKEAKASYSTGGTGYVAYVHSLAESEMQTLGTWRQKHTSVMIKPGQEVKYAFKYRWADDYDGVRDVLYDNGGVDVRVAPGMVVPEDLFVKVALRTKENIGGLKPEFPTETQIEYVGQKRNDISIYKIEFSRLGENRVTVEYGSGKSLHLEFFVTQPLETLMAKRAEFIVEKQQWRDKSLWYDGLYSLWDVRNPRGKNLLGPDNMSGQHLYALAGSDDPSNSKCVYLSEMNVAFPDADQIESLEYFLENFVWGKHQRTDKEIPYPYGIYGSEHWKENREAVRDPIEEGKSRPGKGGSQCRMWRSFDYTTYFAVYYNMYLIAKQNPDMVEYLDAEEYLERAFGTVKSYFEVPYNIYMEGGWAFTGWTDWAYKLGNFHEKYLLGIIEALEETGQQVKADYIRGEWEKKVKYFIYDDAYPFTSEMPVDSTAYESSYAVAKYAMLNELKPDNKLWKDKNTGQWYSHPVIDKAKHADFMERQMMANLACRGWLEASYYFLGSDFRGLGSSGYTLSYMSQMGGWSVLDYSLYFAKEPEKYLRLGYSSMLSTWALVNAGDKKSNYGFWYPGKLHDGSVGWGFCPQKVGAEWNRGCWDKDAGGVKRGAWPVCGEIDHGLTAGVEVACTVVLDDPLFGLFAYGGQLDNNQGAINVIPRDGIRRRLHVLTGDERLHLRFNRDGFARDKAVELNEDYSQIKFVLERRSKLAHSTGLSVVGLKSGQYGLVVDGKKVSEHSVSKGQEVVFDIPVKAGGKDSLVLINRLQDHNNWQPVTGHIMTKWASEVSPQNALPEYPRPQMIRKQWQNLNGLWEYAITPKDASSPKGYDGKILVPFAVESALSGVGKTVGQANRLWYRRTFTVPKKWAGKRTLIHFGAVDWDATVWVNGKRLGNHKGGYDPFTFDLTSALKKSGPQEIVVSVWDPTDKGTQPRGKQLDVPGGIWYTPVTGIWQTVWLEPVEEARIQSMTVTTDIDSEKVYIAVDAENAGGCTFEAKAKLPGLLGRTFSATGKNEMTIHLPKAKLWSPDAPNLYDLTVTIKKDGKVLDKVESYFGMRKIVLEKDESGISRLFLNNKLLFHYGPLDQGWWPDGLYTAPTDEALRYDVEVTKKLGFNMLRKHVKVEPARLYYWCDKLGLMVWQDMPNGDRHIGQKDPDIIKTPESAKQFETEWGNIIDTFRNHPCIVMWVPFNEGWGQYDTERIAQMTKDHDPTRLVNSVSGWTDRGVGDVHDIHIYTGPGMPPVEEHRAAVLGEFGGLGLPVAGHTWQAESNWGYQTYKTPEELTDAYVELISKLNPLIGKGLAAAVYTQTSDVEVEVNGLMTYDRAVLKMDTERVVAANCKLYLPPTIVKTVVQASDKESAIWRYTTTAPADDWFKSGYDDSQWQEGPGGFGTLDTPSAVVGTNWDSKEIWIRRSFELETIDFDSLKLYIHHDEDAAIYINGVPAATENGYTVDYITVPINEKALKTLKKGANVIAIHCRQTGGGQYIDAGLVNIKN